MSTSENEANPKMESRNEIPRIPVNLWDRKLGIAINWGALLLSSLALPLILYFTLRYSANLKLSTVLAIDTAIFGAFSLFALFRRTWSLVKRDSTTRPLGGSRWGMDFFNWNFLFGFVVVAVVIIVGNVIKSVRTVALGLPILVVDVAAQLLIAAIFAKTNIRSPVRISSMAKGQRVRSGVYSICEDIMAVDADLGQEYRRQLEQRYLASLTVRRLCWQMDLIWGVSGVAVGAVAIGLLYGLDNENVGYILGWVIPWGYAGIMAVFTIVYTRVALKHEKLQWVN